MKQKRKVRKPKARKPARTKIKPDMKSETRIDILDNRVGACITKINELVTKTNDAMKKICSVLDKHEKDIKDVVSCLPIMQDSLKTLTSTVNKYVEKREV